MGSIQPNGERFDRPVFPVNDVCPEVNLVTLPTQRDARATQRRPTIEKALTRRSFACRYRRPARRSGCAATTRTFHVRSVQVAAQHLHAFPVAPVQRPLVEIGVSCLLVVNVPGHDHHAITAVEIDALERAVSGEKFGFHACGGVRIGGTPCWASKCGLAAGRRRSHPEFRSVRQRGCARASHRGSLPAPNARAH